YLDGQERSLAAAAGHPLLICFWSPGVAASRAALESLSKAGALTYAIAVPSDAAPTKAAGVPVMLATDEVAGAYNVVHRYLFDRRENLPLPTAFLINATGEIVKVYHGPGSIAPAAIAADVAKIDATEPAARLARALP